MFNLKLKELVDLSIRELKDNDVFAGEISFDYGQNGDVMALSIKYLKCLKDGNITNRELKDYLLDDIISIDPSKSTTVYDKIVVLHSRMGEWDDVLTLESVYMLANYSIIRYEYEDFDFVFEHYITNKSVLTDE